MLNSNPEVDNRQLRGQWMDKMVMTLFLLNIYFGKPQTAG